MLFIEYLIKNKNMNKKKGFEIGKAYEHNAGMQLFICGIADTVLWGRTFIAENSWNPDKLKKRIELAKENREKLPYGGFNQKELSPVSFSEDSMENWFEIPKEDFVSSYTSKD
jgi:hypothetical protein